MVKEGIQSPDVADSLSLTFYDDERGFEKNMLTVSTSDYSIDNY